MPREATARDWQTLLVLTVLWGSAFVLNELALSAFPPAVLVAGRILVAMAFICGYLLMGDGKLPPIGRAWLPMVVLAVFGNVLPFHLVAWAQQHIDSSMAGILLGVVPLFVMTLAHFLIPGGRLTRWRILGFVIGFSGVIMIEAGKQLYAASAAHERPRRGSRPVVVSMPNVARRARPDEGA